MLIGITGTRSMLNASQKDRIQKFLQNYYTHGSELHHGDCIGADAEVADIAKRLGYKIICHPPIKNELRAFHSSDLTNVPQSYFARNRAIVDQTEHLIVAPFQDEWQPNGGTWYTHDYAKKKNKPLTIFYPNILSLWDKLA